MLNAKSLKINKRTMNLVLQGSDKDLCNLDRYEFIALSLLHGCYNPLRQYSKTDPICLTKLKEFENRYSDLISDMIRVMDVDVEDIEIITE